MAECGSLDKKLLGLSRTVGAARELVEEAAATDTAVMLLGEPGTGKQLVAQLIHESSGRAEEPFLMIDCSLYYERELKRELFGLGETANSTRSRKGVFEFASAGTCYLSHVEELSPALQAELRQFLEEGTFRRLGDRECVTSGVRLVASSDKNLPGFVCSGLFEQALFDCLAGTLGQLAPLRERREDISAIVEEMQRAFLSGCERGSVPTFAPETLRALEAYPWPLNVDELKKEIKRLLETGSPQVTPESLSMEISSFWLGQSNDPEIRSVLEELEGYIREFRIMSRLSGAFGQSVGFAGLEKEPSRSCFWDLTEEC
jgi:DNA-binding NtrC family response regulator